METCTENRRKKTGEKKIFIGLQQNVKYVISRRMIFLIIYQLPNVILLLLLLLHDRSQIETDTSFHLTEGVFIRLKNLKLIILSLPLFYRY